MLHVNFDGGRLRTQSSPPASLSTEAGPGFPLTRDVAAVRMSPEAGDKGPTKAPPQASGEPVRLSGRKHSQSDSPLPLRLCAYLQHWTFASPMAQRVIRKGLTWKWVNKPPAPLRPPPSTCRGTLTHHISRLLAEGIIAEVPLQRCYPSYLFSVPKTSDPGGERVVIDLSSLNLHIACPTF